jgi:hypothetical protein
MHDSQLKLSDSCIISKRYHPIRQFISMVLSCPLDVILNSWCINVFFIHRAVTLPVIKTFSFSGAINDILFSLKLRA